MKKLFLGLIVLLSVIHSYAQNHTISGYVEDAATGERLIGCIVKEANNNKYVTSTNEFGFFSLKLPKKQVKIRVYYIGYAPMELDFKLSKDTSLTIDLELANQLNKVVVNAEHYNIESSQMSKIDVPLKMMKNLPVIFGEVDLLKTLQLMPGVQSGTEGSNGIYVRGGGPDQNLILLDGVPVYNVSHLFGFFSVFNTDALKDVTLLKGGFPARYGGRLSSVIDIRMKDGNMKKLKGAVSIGLISSKFTIEGPIKKNKTSFIISARRTYIDILAKPFIKIFGNRTYSEENSTDKTNNSGGYFFYDLNAKLTHKLSDKDRLFLSFYGGKDKAYINTRDENTDNHNLDGEDLLSSNIFADKSNLFWANTITAARWNHSFAKNLFLNTTLTYSRFNFAFGDETLNQSISLGDKEEDELFGISYGSGIKDFAAKIDFNYFPVVNHKIRFGFSSIYHYFMPGQTHFYFDIKDKNDTSKLDLRFGSDTLFAREFSSYFEDDIVITPWFKMNIGARLSIFNVRDTTFVSPEPRISARILLNKNMSLKFSYAKMKQYLHFLTNNTVGLPLDIWVPATNIVVPEDSWQVASGMSWLISDKFTLTLEGFYKEMNNLVEYKEGESIFGNVMQQGKSNSWEQKVTQGRGQAYGGEFFLKKASGKLTGWIAYTLSWTNRTFAGINFGKTFPYKYDRRHDISVVALYKLNKNINFGLTWVYGSGTPTTIAKSQYFDPLDENGSIEMYANDNSSYDYWINGINYYQNRNAFRLPAYHRLDLSMNISKKRKHGTRTWSFGIYNVYNHINPFYTELITHNGANNKTQTFLRVYSIFPIMPSVSYRFVW